MGPPLPPDLKGKSLMPTLIPTPSANYIPPIVLRQIDGVWYINVNSISLAVDMLRRIITDIQILSPQQNPVSTPATPTVT
jgi:hypothetical protein